MPTMSMEPQTRTTRAHTLEMDPAQFRTLGYRLIDEIANHWETLPEKRVMPAGTPGDIRAALDADAPLPQLGSDPGNILREATELLLAHSTFIAHPNFYGYITSGGNPIGVLADLLASAVNPNVGGWKLSPMATEIEGQTVRWLAELIGYPTDCGGLLVSGGNMANFIGVYAARAARAPWPVREEGIAAPAARPLRIYASAETHTWLHKAADLAGLGTNAIRWIPTDEQHKPHLPTLRRMVAEDRAAGAVPLMVVGTAGSVSAGIVDPLPAMAAFCREEDLWFHVDGAYGAFAAGVEGAPADLEGLREADSLAMDPHKWLYAPLEAGCALVRNPEHLRNAFSYHPPYYNFEVEGQNYFDYGMQNSRGFRALKVWAALRQTGKQGVHAMIAEDIALAERLFQRLAAHPCFQAVSRHLSITTFRYVPPRLRNADASTETADELNTLNRALLDEIEHSGEAFLSQAICTGRFLLRACVLNYRTTAEDIDALPERIARLGAAVDARLHP